MSKNDITGDNLVSKPATKNYEDGWERIYGNARPVVDIKEETLIEKRLNAGFNVTYFDEQSNPKVG